METENRSHKVNTAYYFLDKTLAGANSGMLTLLRESFQNTYFLGFTLKLLMRC